MANNGRKGKVFKALDLMLLLALLTVWFTANQIIKFAGKIIIQEMLCKEDRVSAIFKQRLICSEINNNVTSTGK